MKERRGNKAVTFRQPSVETAEKSSVSLPPHPGLVLYQGHWVHPRVIDLDDDEDVDD
jgi:hypothetical protein